MRDQPRAGGVLRRQLPKRIRGLWEASANDVANNQRKHPRPAQPIPRMKSASEQASAETERFTNNLLSVFGRDPTARDSDLRPPCPKAKIPPGRSCERKEMIGH